MAQTMLPSTANDLQIGIIGMGLMGKIVNACDRSEKYEELKKEFATQENVNILEDGHHVSRLSDWTIYNVEAEKIDTVVALYGRSTKVGAIVGGQTSCKAPEISAFEKHLPKDVNIVSCHSLHAPGINPKGQPLVIIQHRAPNSSVQKVEQILSCFESKYVYLTAKEHDRITADTQAVTHAAFLSMGAAWKANNQFPWELPRYIGGIENIKINVTLRIYANQWHVYAGLAIMNPSAKQQIKQYAESVTELFKLMLGGHRDDLAHRIRNAGNAVFGSNLDHSLLLEDEVLDKFSLGVKPPKPVKNNHLSLLAMVDCWWKLGIIPYDHMICSTPLFRLLLGSAEYLFRKPGLIEEVIETAVDDNTFRADDLEFTFAARDWSQRVILGNMEAYREKFDSVKLYFSDRFPEATRLGNEMIKSILEKTGDS